MKYIEQRVDDLEALSIDARLKALETHPAIIAIPILPPADPLAFTSVFSKLGPIRTLLGTGESDDHIWWVEQKAPDRAIGVVVAGRNGLRLHTEPGDTNVSGSGASERCDVALRNGQERHQGDEDGWAHSILFPDDYAIPPVGHWASPFCFHDLPLPTDTRVSGQANFHLFANPGGLLTFRGNGGPVIDDGSGNQYTFVQDKDIGVLVRNVWYDFVYHVRWSSGADGFFKAWVNGAKKLDHKGPTLYTSCAAYLKLANYHSAWGSPSSVIHARVLRGKTPQSVSLTPLEGVP